MSKKKKPETIADDEVTPPLGTSAPEEEPLPSKLAPLPLAPDPVPEAKPEACAASKADKQCTLASGHPGPHHHVPSGDTIDAIVSWA